MNPVSGSHRFDKCFSDGIPAVVQEFTVPPFLNCIVSVSQLDAVARNRIKSIVESNGGTYSANFSYTCTHLVALDPQGDKFKYARQWKVPVVRESWIDAMLDRHGCVEMDSFLLLAPAQPCNLSSSDNLVRRSLSFEILEDEIEYDPNCDDYLSGCVVVLMGFSNEALYQQLCQILLYAGATRLDEVRPFVTHLIMPDAIADPVSTTHCRSVTPQWLIDCYRSKSCIVVNQTYRPRNPNLQLGNSSSQLVGRDIRASLPLNLLKRQRSFY